MSTRRIPVEELQLGMYVTALDRPWTETPFLYQGFVLEAEEQIATLRRLCRHVHIDIERSRAPAARIPALPRGAGDIVIRGASAYPETAEVETEFAHACEVYVEADVLLEDCVRSLERSNVLEGPRLREAVSRLTESVVRNPSALQLAARMRAAAPHILSRALDVSVYMIVFGRFLQLEREELDLLGLTGLLQDVGKTRMPAELMDKRERLSLEEIDRVRSHVLHSIRIVRSTPGLPERLYELVALHHERYDGSGYPRGLKGAEIGLHGSIAAIVDSFDAMTSARPYAEPQSPSNALGTLYKARGTKFHGALVEQFIQCIGAFPVGSLVELNTGEIGIVISQNMARRLKPRVAVVRDARGNPLRPHKILDLMREPKANAHEPYQIRRTVEHGRVRIEAREFFA